MAEQLLHVNECLDDDGSENATLAANQLAERSWTHCPICRKKGCTLNHLRKCAKDRNIYPRDVVTIIQKFEQDMRDHGLNAFSKLGRKQPVIKPKKEPAVKRQKKELVKKKEDTQVTQIDEITEEPVVVSTFFTGQTITAKDGKIVVPKVPLSKEQIDGRVEQIIKFNLVENFKVIEETQAPHFFRLASLECDREELICQSFANRMNVKKPVGLATRVPFNSISPSQGFFVEESSEILEISDTESFFSRLKTLRNEEASKDLIINCQGKQRTSCHSFIWKMNTNSVIIDSQVDATGVSRELVDSFVSYCYSGLLRFSTSHLSDMSEFLKSLSREDLVHKIRLYTS
jgi:hypothetical protein